MSVRGTFYISWHEEVKWLNLQLSSRMGMWYIFPAGALFWQLSIHLHMDGITNRVLSLFQCFRKVQVLNVSFDISLHVGGGRKLHVHTDKTKIPTDRYKIAKFCCRLRLPFFLTHDTPLHVLCARAPLQMRRFTVGTWSLQLLLLNIHVLWNCEDLPLLLQAG